MQIGRKTRGFSYIYIYIKQRKTMVHTRKKSVHITPNIYITWTKFESRYMSGCVKSHIIL